MQRYSEGLKVPLQKVDVFTGKTSSAISEIVCLLTYHPKDINHIIIASNLTVGGEVRIYEKVSLVGRTLTLYSTYHQYSKADSPIGTTDAAGGGAVAEPHSHIVSSTSTATERGFALNEAQGPVVIHYTVG